MKRIGFFAATMLFGITVAFAQGKPEIKFSETTYDFGEILEENGDATHVFTFTNVGDAPLELTSVTAACGCTIPEWTDTPIAPGKTGFVKATYRVKGSSPTFNKTVSVHTNAQEAPYTLVIKGRVKAAAVEQSELPVSLTSAPVDLQSKETIVNPDVRKAKAKIKKKKR